MTQKSIHLFPEDTVRVACDNRLLGDGSYSWYIDKDGLVQTLLYEYPTTDYKSYQEVYP